MRRHQNRRPRVNSDKPLSSRLNRITVALFLLVALAVSAKQVWVAQRDDPRPVSGRPLTTETETPAPAEATAKNLIGNSIAVLPFISRSAGPESIPVLADGFHGELTARLARIPGVTVISRSSAAHFRETTLSQQMIADTLGVANLLEGVLQQSGNRFKLNLQLIHARTSEALWSQTYDRVLTVENLFDVQDQIVGSIAGMVQSATNPAQAGVAGGPPTSSLEAYQAVLISRQFQHRESLAATAAAIDLAKKAIALDPEYVEAYVALARALASSVRREPRSADEVRPELSDAIHTAFSVDPEHAGAWSAWASFQFITGSPEAMKSLERAAVLNPGDARTLRDYGLALLDSGKPDEALSVLLQAGTLDPLSPFTLLAIGNAHDALEDYAAARRIYARIREMDSSNTLGYTQAAWSFLSQGRVDDALTWLSRAQAIDPKNTELGGLMVFLHDCLENYLSAKEWSDWLVSRVTNQPLPMAMQAGHYYMMGRFELALQYSNLALKLDLPNRLNSDAIFMRLKRDEALANGDPESGIEVFTARYPQLFGARPDVTKDNISQATDLALLLKLAGRREELQRILDAVVAAYNQPYFTSGPARNWLMPLKAEALAILGDEQASLAELKRIVDNGWRAYWRLKTDLNPNFSGIRESDGFKLIVRELESDIARQRDRVHSRVEQGEIAPPAAQGSP